MGKKYTVHLSRTKTETAKVEVEARDKRSASLQAAAQLDKAAWETEGSPEIVVKQIDKVEAPHLPLTQAAASTTHTATPSRSGKPKAA